MDQQIRFCELDGARIAYATAGEGPPLVLPAMWLGHIEVEWTFPELRAFVAGLGRSTATWRTSGPSCASRRAPRTPRAVRNRLI